MNEKKTPRIRFKGFTDDWEQRKLGELYTERNERGNRSLQILSVSIHTGVSDGELDVDNLGKFIRRSEDKSTYKHVHSGDLIFNMMRAWQGAIGVVKNEGMVSPAYISAIPDDSVFPEFMDYCLRRKRIINQINNLSYGVTDFRKRLYWEPFTRVTIMMPSVDEQRKITDIFHQLDDLITLHQRKLEKLKIVKKTMLVNCFPKNGEKVPKFKFSGFTDDWEQRKLGELAEIKDSARIPNAEWSDFGVPYIRASDITNKDASGVLFISNERYEFYKNKTGAPIKGDVLFNGGGEIGKTMLNSSDSPIYVQGGAVLYARTSISDNLEGQYLKTYFETPNAQHYFETASAGGTMKHFTLKPSQEMPIKLPQMKEQKKIGSFFSELDTLITLHQSKCYGRLRHAFLNTTISWEQRKLSDIYKDIGNAFVGTATPYYVEEGHFYLESNNIKDGLINHNTEVFINDVFYENQKDKWLHTGDMVMVQSGHVGHAAVIPKELDCSAAHALIMFRNPKVEIEPYFLNYQYQTAKSKKKIENITTGNTIKHILASEMQEFIVDVTSYGEQKKIAGFFRDLDNLITLHQKQWFILKKLQFSPGSNSPVAA